jgi:hypothetical protein
MRKTRAEILAELTAKMRRKEILDNGTSSALAADKEDYGVFNLGKNAPIAIGNRRTPPSARTALRPTKGSSGRGAAQVSASDALCSFAPPFLCTPATRVGATYS